MTSPTQRKVTCHEIISAVTDHFGLRITDLVWHKRVRRIAYPRHITASLMFHMADKTYSEIGRRLGGRDHTTIMASVQRADELCEKDQDFAADMAAIRQVLELEFVFKSSRGKADA